MTHYKGHFHYTGYFLHNVRSRCYVTAVYFPSPLLHVKRCSEHMDRWTCEQHGWPHRQSVIPYSKTTMQIIYCPVPVLWCVNVSLKQDIPLTWMVNVISVCSWNRMVLKEQFNLLESINFEVYAAAIFRNEVFWVIIQDNLSGVCRLFGAILSLYDED